mgnify:CR=1 FL=1|jgi:predicted amidohydrolase YtcJ
MKLLKMIRVSVLLCIIPFAAAELANSSDVFPLTIYVAKKIITMDPALPEATAVAVSDGKIVAVGSLKTLDSWSRNREVIIDESFKNKVVMPGFIDPHVHPSLPAVLTQFDFLAPDDWSLPTGDFPGAKNNQDYIRRLKVLAAGHKDPSIPYIAWGYHPLWHGEVYRAQLDEIFPDQPVMLWHRSFHELIANTAALELLGVTEEEVQGQHEVNWAKGHFWELGARFLLPKMPFLFAPQRYGKGMENFLAMVHRGGVTTVLDMGLGVFGNPKQELEMIRHTAESLQSPARIIMTPIVTYFIAAGKTPVQAMAEIDQWRQSNSSRVLIDNHFKLMMDGAIFSGLAQFDYPGYIDGHKGVWLAPVDVTAVWAEAFWEAGYKLHAHTNGDLSAAELIKIVRGLQQKTPRVDHRFTLEHFAYATEEQSRQMAALGMVVSANPYYQFILSDIYADQWLGNDRARKMVPLGSLERAGVPFALHSDSPMAPLSPLTLAATAVERKTINGNINHRLERISVDSALRAITIDAAWIMGWEDRIGSIRAGKIADFTILNEDPYEVSVSMLKDIDIWGTVFEGKAYPIVE